jgi:hypothetical protein
MKTSSSDAISDQTFHHLSQWLAGHFCSAVRNCLIQQRRAKASGSHKQIPQGAAHLMMRASLSKRFDQALIFRG